MMPGICENDVESSFFALSINSFSIFGLELFPSKNSCGVMSRKAAVKLMADEDRHDYFRRFVSHKVNQNYTVLQISFLLRIPK